MSDYRHGSHTTFSIYLPIVWITQYRYKVLRGEDAERIRALVHEACQKEVVMQDQISRIEQKWLRKWHQIKAVA
jgi:REP element-mobilizing transposase RayT